MTPPNVKTITTVELVERFVSIAVDQDKALFDENNTKFNRLYRQMDDVTNELKSRPNDQRSVLLALYNHPNVQVRLKAVLATLDMSCELAREALRKTANSPQFPDQAAGALAALWRLDGKPPART